MALLGFYIEMSVSTIFPTTLCRNWDSNLHQTLFRDLNRTLNRPSYRGRGKKRRRWKNYFYSRNGNVYGLDESAAFESKARNRPQRKSFGAFFFHGTEKEGWIRNSGFFHRLTWTSIIRRRSSWVNRAASEACKSLPSSLIFKGKLFFHFHTSRRKKWLTLLPPLLLLLLQRSIWLCLMPPRDDSFHRESSGR